MNQTQNSKPYDLEERTRLFAKNGTLPKTIANIEIAKQVVRSSGSVGANFIEASEALSKKDFALRIKICRKEVKESRYWLSLIEINNEDGDRKRQILSNEATELMRIFGSIIEKTKE
jgi:four helix bundle protein